MINVNIQIAHMVQYKYYMVLKSTSLAEIYYLVEELFETRTGFPLCTVHIGDTGIKDNDIDYHVDLFNASELCYYLVHGLNIINIIHSKVTV